MIDGGLRKIFHSKLPDIHWQAIETGSTGKGIPDSNGCYQGVEFWCEFKKTSANVVNLSPEQVGWILRRKRAGGNVYIAVRKKRSQSVRREACDELWLFSGIDAAHLKEGGLKSNLVLPLGIWRGGPNKWDWQAVKKQIIY